MSTNWALPTLINQFAEEGAEDLDVSWIEEDSFFSLKHLDKKFVKTSRDLVHIARDPKHDIEEKTYYLKLTGFNFSNIPTTLSGIEMKLTSNRFGRITDDTIQLTTNGNFIGDNKSTSDTNPIKVYGGNDDKWNSNLTIADVLNSTFGVILRFKSHPNWPHKNSAMIDSVQLRVY